MGWGINNSDFFISDFDKRVIILSIDITNIHSGGYFTKQLSILISSRGCYNSYFLQNNGVQFFSDNTCVYYTHCVRYLVAFLRTTT